MDFSRVNTYDFVKSLNMRNITESEDEVIFSCPFPEGHKNNDQNPSAAMSKVNKLFHCFGCKKSHNPVSFLAELEGITHVTAEKFIVERYGDRNYEGISLSKFFKDKLESPKETIERVTKVNECNKVLPWALCEERRWELLGPPLYYLYSRNFNLDTIKYFNLGYDELSDMVVIPVCNENGELLGFKGRVYDEFEGDRRPKYRVIGDRTGNTWGFPTVNVQHEVFNLHNLIEGQPAIVVEGEFDAMMLWQNGFHNVVSLYGSTFTEAQKQKILQKSNNLILFLDSDDAGNKCRDKIIRELSDYCIIKVVDKHDRDPAELTKEECQDLIDNAKSPLQKMIMNIER